MTKRKSRVIGETEKIYGGGPWEVPPRLASGFRMEGRCDVAIARALMD